LAVCLRVSLGKNEQVGTKIAEGWWK